jgi:hypothetical protein|nr:MAG TPA: NUMOD4 motif protein [Caudoviricetes sp.]
MKESWKDIPGYDGKYQADMEGNIRRVYQSGKTRLMTPYHKKMSGSKRLVVKMTQDKKAKEEILVQIMAKTFLGNPLPGHVPYHKNGCQEDNYIQNIAYISRRDLGKLTGRTAKRQPVAKIDVSGEIVEVYSSARECARKNYMSYQTVIDRCNGKCKSAYAPDGYAYAWDDKEVSMRNAIRKIERENGYMPKARNVDFEF